MGTLDPEEPRGAGSLLKAWETETGGNRGTGLCTAAARQEEPRTKGRKFKTPVAEPYARLRGLPGGECGPRRAHAQRLS